MTMAAFWTEIYVRTETAYRKRIEEAQAGGYGYSGNKVFEAKDGMISLYDLRPSFDIPDHLEVTHVYSAWYQPTMYHEDLNKFRTLDVKTEGFLGNTAGTGVTLEAQSVAGEDAQINIRVHMICDVQPKRQA